MCACAHTHMRVCICVGVVCVCVYVCAHTCTCVHVSVCICVGVLCVCVHVSVCICVGVVACVCPCVRVRTRECVHTRGCGCVRVCTCVHAGGNWLSLGFPSLFGLAVSNVSTKPQSCFLKDSHFVCVPFLVIFLDGNISSLSFLPFSCVYALFVACCAFFRSA